ncbi:Exodeoxyribonuclease 7 small subunit [Rubripirellula tenax]|uniref:Exodeoxyribonuclease 7 small subunit n=1 Tax=Rubripirellula tenax TaxID=2528015 RepID=A0A5C6EK12_9BACT|nr:exodeoxyribonuclease VII small subunit [Rubripirellula tenax]TWU47619.1 Exodeoxyribonuclease 7 small subunit [Rubripirellula tenax]
MAKKKVKSSVNAATDEGVEQDSSIDFESALADVEAIVGSLESGELSLTESLGHYETGVRRLKQCHQLLAAAEQRVSVLSGFDADGNPITESLGEMEVRGGSGRASKAGTAKTATRRKSANSSKANDEGTDGPLNRSDDEQSVDDRPGLF